MDVSTERRQFTRGASENLISEEKERVLSLLAGVKNGEMTIEQVVDGLAREIASLKQERMRDPLTGALNRNAIMLLATEESKRDPNLGVLFVDIDHFKEVNDKDLGGHAAGDRALKETVKMMTEVVGKDGVIGRWGGEEFVILLPGTNVEKMVEIGSKLGNIAQAELATKAQLISRESLTLSIGGAKLGSGGLEQMVNEADRAMYEVKNSTRNGLLVYSLGGDPVRVDFSSLQKGG